MIAVLITLWLICAIIVGIVLVETFRPQGQLDLGALFAGLILLIASPVMVALYGVTWIDEHSPQWKWPDWRPMDWVIWRWKP